MYSPIVVDYKECGKKLRRIVKEVREGTFDYASREKHARNWSLYDLAQIQELAQYISDIRDVVEEADRRIQERKLPQIRGAGRPPTEPADIVKILLLQAYTYTPNRVAEGLLLLFKEKLGIFKHFSYKTIERGYDKEAVDDILDEVVLITNECVKDKEKTGSFDGKGFTASKKENYAARRQKQSSKKKRNTKTSSNNGPKDTFPKSASSNRAFTYSVLGIGVRYKLISGMVISPNYSIGETSMFPVVFQQTHAAYPNMERALGDGIYGCRKAVDTVFNSGVLPFFLPRSNVTLKSRGCAGWHPMLLPLADDPQSWLEDYHMRSISETVNSMIECRFGGPLRKLKDGRKVRETKLKLVGHDVRRIGYLRIIEGIIPTWSRTGAMRGA